MALLPLKDLSPARRAFVLTIATHWFGLDPWLHIPAGSPWRTAHDDDPVLPLHIPAGRDLGTRVLWGLVADYPMSSTAPEWKLFDGAWGLIGANRLIRFPAISATLAADDALLEALLREGAPT